MGRLWKVAKWLSANKNCLVNIDGLSDTVLSLDIIGSLQHPFSRLPLLSSVGLMLTSFFHVRSHSRIKCMLYPCLPLNGKTFGEKTASLPHTAVLAKT